jgi:hypothetical protein
MKDLTLVLALLVAGGCAQTTSTAAADVPNGRRGVPAKCTACHLAPAEHSLAAEKWQGYIKAHKRRLRLTEQEQSFLYDFLVGGERPTATTP